MSKRRVTLRVEESTVRAYDRADGNRSALMRRAVRRPIKNGELQGIGEDLKTLAAIESTVDRGRLERKRGTFRKRCAEYFEEKWSNGYTSAEDVEIMAESWRSEGAIYGAEYLAWVEAVVGWYKENWDPLARPDWPGAGTFHAIADPDSVDVPERLVEVLRDAKKEGLERDTAVDRISRYHPRPRVEKAADQAGLEAN